LHIRGYKNYQTEPQLKFFLVCWTRRKCQTNTFRFTLAYLNFIGLRQVNDLIILTYLT